MNRAEAIRKKCLECAGSTKEVILCHIFDCPIWQYRTGYSMKNQKYKEKMRYAKKVYEKDFIELKKMGVAIAKFTRF